MQNNQHLLFSNLVVWLSPLLEGQKRYAFDRMKIKLLQKMVKKRQKVGDVEPEPIVNNYMSINDFKPINDAYSSIKISDESQQKSYQTIRKFNMTQLIVNQQNYLDQWMIRTKPQKIMMQEYPKSIYCLKSVHSYSEQALKTVKGFKFSNFCRSTLRKKTNWLFQQVNPLKYKNSQISMSLVLLPQTKIQIALQMFQQLLKAAMDKPSQHPNIFNLYDFIYLIMNDIDDLKEEGYLQVIKQFQSHKLNYLKILACLSATVQPTTRMYLPLLNYVHGQIGDVENIEKHEYFSYIFYQLIKNYDKPRIHYPSIFELSCHKQLRKIPITICFPRERIFFIEAYTTVEQLLKEMISFYNLDPEVEYMLFIQNILMETGILLDKLNHYWRDKDFSQKQKYINFEGYKAMIVLKNMHDIERSPRCFNIMFNYFVQQYRAGLYVTTAKQVVKIGGLIMFSEVEDAQNYQFSFARLIPKEKIKKLDEEKLKNYKSHILKTFFEFQGTKDKAKREILSILEKKKGYMTHFFKCHTYRENDEPVKTWVGIKKDSFLFIQPATGRIMKIIPFNTIMKWGESRKEMVFQLEKTRYHVQTRSAEIFGSIFKNYLKYNIELLREKEQGILK